MNLRTIFIIFAIGIFTPFFGVFAASDKEDTMNSSSGTSSTGIIADEKEITATGGVSGTGSKKDEKRNLKKGIVNKNEKEDSLTGSSDDEFSEEEKGKVQQEINNYILGAYKMQGNKILKDIDVSLQKVNPDNQTRIQAYLQIQKTLELRRKRIKIMNLSDNNKEILLAYLDYMIGALEKRQAELKD